LLAVLAALVMVVAVPEATEPQPEHLGVAVLLKQP
jgi:hypothetical protein